MNFFWGCCCLVIFFASCGKKENSKLADAYFRMSFLELSDESDTEHAIKRALAAVNQALAHHQRPEYHAFKATLLFKLGSYDQSESCFKRALALKPTETLRAEIMNNYACLLAQSGQVTRAQEIWTTLKANTAYQTPEVAWVNLGKTYIQAKDFGRAHEVFAKATQLSPSYVDAHFYLAATALELGQDVCAQRELATVLALEPEHRAAIDLAQRNKISKT